MFNVLLLVVLLVLELFEVFENIDEFFIIGNLVNWMVIGVFVFGVFLILNLNIEDENGNLVCISINESDGDLVNIEFIDDEGCCNYLCVYDCGGDDVEVMLFFDDVDEFFFQILVVDDEVNMLFCDDIGLVCMQVCDQDDDVIIIVIDELIGDSIEFFFQDIDDVCLLVLVNGCVSYVGMDELGLDSVGQYVVIDYGLGWLMVYYGLESVDVCQGVCILCGDLIGMGDLDYDYDWDLMDSDDSFNFIDVVDNILMLIVCMLQVEF